MHDLHVVHVQGIRHGTNWLLFLKTAAAWVVTLVIAGLVSAAVFSFGECGVWGM